MSHKNVRQECPTRVPHKSVLRLCPRRVSYKSVPQACPIRVFCKSVSYKVSHKSDIQECVLQERPTRVTNKSVPQECPTRVSYKSAPQECPTFASHKSVLQECPTSVSYKSVLQECVIQGVPQECATKVSEKNVSYKSVKGCFGVVFEYVFAFRFVGSILLLMIWLQDDLAAKAFKSVFGGSATSPKSKNTISFGAHDHM